MLERVQLTMAQAIVRFMIAQHVDMDGEVTPFFGGLWGIFGHGNIGGMAQAMQQYAPDLPYFQGVNEQSMVHTAIGYAKAHNRRRALACLSSIGPGATNMVTGAAAATIDRLPVMLLAGDIFAERVQAPVLQQMEDERSQDVSVNDAFRPVCRYWDRLNRPEQAITALPEAMRVLTSPADTGAVFLALPQDVQTFAHDYPAAMFEPRVWTIPRNRPDTRQIARAARWIRDAKAPLIVAGGGVRYSAATQAVRSFAEATGIPVAETHAGKGTLPYDHPLSLGAMGVAGTRGANGISRQADLVIGIGTRYTDFTTASKTAFQNPRVRFVNINVYEPDSYKHAALPLIGDAKATLEELLPAVAGYRTAAAYRGTVLHHNRAWDAEVERLYSEESGARITQAAVIGEVERSAAPGDMVVTSAGSLPGDLQKLWRSREPGSYQVEYGYSVMGYEIPGGIGARLACPDREVYVLVGDGTFLMMNADIAAALREGVKLIIVIVDNLGFSSVGRVSEQVGSEGFGCHFRNKGQSGAYDGSPLAIDFAAICAGYGARALRADGRDSLAVALEDARVPGYSECWWDMATAHVAEDPAIRAARDDYIANKGRQRPLMVPNP